MVNIKEFGGNELALAGAVKEDLACSGSSPLNKSDQVISSEVRDGARERALDPGLKRQAASSKLQAPSWASAKRQASSPRRQASSSKPQASSSMICDPLYIE